MRRRGASYSVLATRRARTRRRHGDEARLRPADRQQGARARSTTSSCSRKRRPLSEGRRLGLDVEVAFAPGSTSSASSRSGCSKPRCRRSTPWLTEPANTSTMDLVLRELRGKLGLVILSAVGPVRRGGGAGVGRRACRSARSAPTTRGWARSRGGRCGPPALRRAGALRRRAAALLGGAAAARRRSSRRSAPASRSRRSRPASGRSRTASWPSTTGTAWRRRATRRPRRGRGQRRARAGRAARLRGARRRRAPRGAAEGEVPRRRRLPHVRAEAGGGESARGERLHPREHGPRPRPPPPLLDPGTPVPLRSFTEARPWPPGSAGA